MTTYRLFPATNGPSTVAGSATIVTGVLFAIAGGGKWLDGYWWWVTPTGQPTSIKCALWSATSSGTGVVVPGSVVTASGLTAGAWNYIPLSSPVQLAPSLDPSASTTGSIYIAAFGLVSGGGFPATLSQWNSGDPLAGGITNGPLTAYSGTTGSKPAPYGMGQGVFTVASGDPSVSMPNQQDSSGDHGTNFWGDVQVDDQAPAGYNGTYRLWPNKADANPAIAGDSALDYTIGTEIHLSTPSALANVWYYSQSGAANLATRCDVWNISTGLSVASITSPSWLTASGGAASAGVGWIKAAFAGGTVLPAGSYRVTVYNSNGTVGSWAPKDASTNYWGQGGSGGVGANGITWGPLVAPSQPSASSGFVYNAGLPGATPPYSSGTAINAQPPFGQTLAGTEIFPQLYAPVGGSSNQSQNYWVDLEARPEPASSATLTIAPSFHATAVRGHYRTAALTVTPQLAAARSHGSVRQALLRVVPSFLAEFSGGRQRGERQQVRVAVAQYFGGSQVTSDKGVCFQGGPLTGNGLGTAYPYTVRGVPDEYYTAGQPAGQNWGVVMSTTAVRRTSIRDSYGGGTSGWRARHYAIDCQLELIAELPHIEEAGEGLDDLIDAIHALIASDRTLGTLGGASLRIIQAGEGRAGIADETARFEALDDAKGRYRGTASVSFEVLTMVAS